MVLWRPNGIYRFRDWYKHQPFMIGANFTKLTVENEWEYYDQGWLQIPYISNFIEFPGQSVEQFHGNTSKKCQNFLQKQK